MATVQRAHALKLNDLYTIKTIRHYCYWCY